MAEVTPEDIAIELGLDTPTGRTAEQWQSWIDRAEGKIAEAATARGTTIDALNPQTVSDVIIESVAALVKRPDAGSTSEQVAIDDGSMTKRFERSSGVLEITDDMWARLFPRRGQRSSRVGSIRLAVPAYRLPGGGCPR